MRDKGLAVAERGFTKLPSGDVRRPFYLERLGRLLPRPEVSPQVARLVKRLGRTSAPSSTGRSGPFIKSLASGLTKTTPLAVEPVRSAEIQVDKIGGGRV